MIQESTKPLITLVRRDFGDSIIGGSLKAEYVGDIVTGQLNPLHRIQRQKRNCQGCDCSCIEGMAAERWLQHSFRR